MGHCGCAVGGADRKEAIDVLSFFRHRVHQLISLPAYGQGLSEEIMEGAIRIFLAIKCKKMTKFGLRWDTTN